FALAAVAGAATSTAGGGGSRGVARGGAMGVTRAAAPAAGAAGCRAERTTIATTTTAATASTPPIAAHGAFAFFGTPAGDSDPSAVAGPLVSNVTATFVCPRAPGMAIIVRGGVM